MTLSKVWIKPWNYQSVGAAALSRAGGWSYIGNDYGIPNLGASDWIIYWGNSQAIDVSCHALNKRGTSFPSDKATLSKLATMDISVPALTTNLREAVSWLMEDKEILGFIPKHEAVVLFSEDPGTWLKSEFWTVYRKKTSEFLVHAAFDKVFFLEEVVPRESHPTTGAKLSPEEFDFRFRSRRNGFVTREIDLKQLPPKLEADVIKALKVLGLDFGCFKCIYNKVNQNHFILSRIPSPLMSDSLVSAYHKVLSEHIESVDNKAV